MIEFRQAEIDPELPFDFEYLGVRFRVEQWKQCWQTSRSAPSQRDLRTLSIKIGRFQSLFRPDQ